jgi:hypothetical protein
VTDVIDNDLTAADEQMDGIDALLADIHMTVGKMPNTDDLWWMVATLTGHCRADRGRVDVCMKNPTTPSWSIYTPFTPEPENPWAR